MHSGRLPRGDFFLRAEERGNLSWLLASGETGVIHTYQQTIHNTEGETEGVVVVDKDSVAQHKKIQIASVHSQPGVYGILSIIDMYWGQLFTYSCPIYMSSCKILITVKCSHIQCMPYRW